MEALLHDYGWAGVFVYITFKEIVPWLRKRLDKTFDDGAAMKESQRAAETAREERSVKAMENMANALLGIKEILSAVNVRLDVIERHLGLADQPAPPKRRGASE
jgi:hypothetical protein